MDRLTEAYEILGDLGHAGPFVFTCEHASNRLPWHDEVSPSDRRLLDDHWGWDIGAADVTRALVEHFGAQGVLARFSRLLVDANRRLDSDTLVLKAAGDVVVDLNRGVDDDERKRRVRTLYQPYHDAVDHVIAARAALELPFHLVAVHSFTPSYLGRKRPMEIGVLYDTYEEEAFAVHGALAAEGFETALNAPYSGKGPEGLIFSAQHHGEKHEGETPLKYIEFEIRQDLIDTDAKAREVAARMARGLAPFLP